VLTKYNRPQLFFVLYFYNSVIPWQPQRLKLCWKQKLLVHLPRLWVWVVCYFVTWHDSHIRYRNELIIPNLAYKEVVSFTKKYAAWYVSSLKLPTNLYICEFLSWWFFYITCDKLWPKDFGELIISDFLQSQSIMQKLLLYILSVPVGYTMILYM